MSYQSPLHIIKGLATETDFQINDTNLIRLRKQLLAELNLSGETTITVNKKQYSKDEIIKTIDLLLNNPNLDVHEFIYNNLFLLKYLEDDSLTLNTNLYSKLEISETIKGKLENIIYDRFIVQFKKGMSVRNFANAEGALVLMNTLTDNYKNECYEEVHKSLYTFSTYLLELESSIGAHHKNDLMFLTYQSLAILLNSLPEDFDGIKNEITVRIINLVVAYHNLKNHSADISKGISTMLLKINCEEEHSKLIRNNHKVFSNTSSSSSSSSSETAPWRIIIFVIIVLVNVLRMGRGCSSSHNSSSFNTNYLNNLQSQSEYNKLYSGQSNLYHLDNYRAAVKDKLTMDKSNFNSMYDTAKFHTGSKPFHNTSFYVTDTSYTNWKHSITINNKTNYDLIVMYYDSTKANFISCFIDQKDKFELPITNPVNFVFYFGNNLLEPGEFVKRPEYEAVFPEFFATNNQANVDLLYKTYQLTLSKQKSKKIKPVKCTLDLDSTFITNQKSKYKFKKYSLTQVDENNY